MMSLAHAEARAGGYPEVRVGVRSQLPDNLRFYKRLGYRIVAEHRQAENDAIVWIELARSV
jgi:ribosomal protein S18 acetylase RimI-like enzyme